MQIEDNFTPVAKKGQSWFLFFLMTCVFETLFLIAFASTLQQLVSLSGAIALFILILVPLSAYIFWRIICNRLKTAVLTYELPYTANGQLGISRIEFLHDRLIHYYKLSFTPLSQREIFYRDIDEILLYVTIAPNIGQTLMLQLKANASPLDIRFGQFSTKDCVIILDIILRKSPQANQNEPVSKFREGKVNREGVVRE